MTDQMNVGVLCTAGGECESFILIGMGRIVVIDLLH